MRIFVLGGTGQIGTGVLGALKARRHTVLALTRSPAAAAKAAALGAEPVPGDIASPHKWVADLPPVDAVIHAARDLDSPMGEIDRHLLDVLIPHLAHQALRVRFVYTGGNWLFGSTGDVVADEAAPLDPISAFSWMVPGAQRILASDAVDGIVIHPVMVYAPGGGGAFRRFLQDATTRPSVRVFDSETLRWPLVRDDDLAMLYALAVEKAPPRSTYIGGAIDGLATGRIARAFAHRFSTPNAAPEIVSVDAFVREHGEWARGYALDQQLSGAKARRELGWRPKAPDPLNEIASLVA